MRFMQAADTLDDVHSRGIMHRDFKLASIMVKPRGQVKVSDFDLAKLTKPPSRERPKPLRKPPSLLASAAGKRPRYSANSDGACTNGFRTWTS